MILSRLPTTFSPSFKVSLILYQPTYQALQHIAAPPRPHPIPSSPRLLVLPIENNRAESADVRLRLHTTFTVYIPYNCSKTFLGWVKYFILDPARSSWLLQIRICPEQNSVLYRLLIPILGSCERLILIYLVGCDCSRLFISSPVFSPELMFLKISLYRKLTTSHNHVI